MNNPFLKLRLRNYLIWSFGLLPLLFLTFLNKDSSYQKIIEIVWFYGIMFVWLLIQFERKQISFRRLLGKVPRFGVFLKMLGVIFTLLVFSLGTILMFSSVLAWIAPSVEKVYFQHQESMHTSTPWLFVGLTFIEALVVAPVLEELFFRGFLLHRFATKWGTRRGIILAAVVFGLLHADIFGKIIFAIIMSLLYIRFRSLYVTMFGHMLNNLLPTIFIVTSLFDKQKPSQLTPSDYLSFFWAGFVLVSIGGAVLLLVFRTYWPKDNQLTHLPYFQNEAS